MNKSYLPDTIIYGSLGLYKSDSNIFSFYNNHPVKSHRTLKQLKYIIDMETINEYKIFKN